MVGNPALLIGLRYRAFISLLKACCDIKRRDPLIRWDLSIERKNKLHAKSASVREGSPRTTPGDIAWIAIRGEVPHRPTSCKGGHPKYPADMLLQKMRGVAPARVTIQGF